MQCTLSKRRQWRRRIARALHATCARAGGRKEKGARMVNAVCALQSRYIACIALLGGLVKVVVMSFPVVKRRPLQVLS